jgi:nucleoside-diphosphate-sugar epimerase
MTRKTVLILGGGGYVGGALTRRFLRSSEPNVDVAFGLYWFDALPSYLNHETMNVKSGNSLIPIEGDIRNMAEVDRIMKDVDVLIHLACISNDPGFDLNPRLGREINYESLNGIMQSAVSHGVDRVIYASSSAIYGASEGLDRDENDLPNPMTDYAKYKVYSERKLHQIWSKVIPVTVLRPATLCGWTDTAMRFDLMFNSFVAQAILDGGITVKGGNQKRALLALSDMVDLYIKLTFEPDIDRIAGKTWNIGHCNYPLGELATMIAQWRAEEGHECQIQFKPTDDLRSYSINSSKIEEEFDFVAMTGLRQVYEELRLHLVTGEIDQWNTSRYIRLLKLKELGVS